ncbi:uncharacterized protein LOC100877515 [Megachile rotundata]|uniref:uncharacterized protein LOC100877515 n=1 Tax=Megachile rotundata TaxID=143995 RepID=UPI003FD49E20
MSAFQQKYKEKVIGFGNTKESRFIRAKEREESRKRQRAENFNNCRNIPTSSTTENKKMQSNHVVKDNLTRFMKWKAEQERRRIEQMKKKKPFVVGIVHHKVYSPIPSYRTTNSNITNNKVCNKTVPTSSASLPKRITKATEKRLMNKGLIKTPIDQSSKKQKSLNNGQKNQGKQEKSFAPADYRSKSRTNLSRIPLFVGVRVKRISHTKINKSSLSPTKISETSRISNTTEYTVENVNHKNSNITVIHKQEDTDELSESFIEPALIKSLFDEKRFIYNDINNNNNGDSELKVQDTKTLCSSKNNMFILAPNDPQDEAILYSPYVVLSCKKSSARKEQQSECVFNCSDLKDESKKYTPVRQDKTQLNLQEIQISAAMKSIGNLPTVKVDEISSTSRKTILKQSNDSTKIESCIKSTVKVEVDQNIISNEVLVNQEILWKPNLCISPELDECSICSPDEVAINIKRRLRFNSEEFGDGNLQNSELRNSIDRKRTEVPSINIQTATPVKHSDLNNTPFSKTCLTGQYAVAESNKELDEDLTLNITSTQLKSLAENTGSEPHKRICISNKEEPSEYYENIKVLRNRNIIVVNTPTPRRLVRKVNVQELKQKENKTSLKKTRKKSFINNRRGVKSSEKDYCGYVSNKLPTTPHIR